MLQGKRHKKKEGYNLLSHFIIYYLKYWKWQDWSYNVFSFSNDNDDESSRQSIQDLYVGSPFPWGCCGFFVVRMSLRVPNFFLIGAGLCVDASLTFRQLLSVLVSILFFCIGTGTQGTDGANWIKIRWHSFTLSLFSIHRFLRPFSWFSFPKLCSWCERR